jgi:hypothetical protein
VSAAEIPAWWETDREHAPALLAFRFLRAEHFVRGNPDEDGVYIDFEDAWENGPCSGGERVLIALAWCLYNLSYAANWAEEHPDRLNPVRVANPSRAAEILGERHKRTYLTMLNIGFARTEAEVADVLLSR